MLDNWIAALCHELELDVAVDEGLLLDVARDAAHNVARPAAPVTTFLIGLAAGRAGGTPEDVARAAEVASRLALAWSPTEPA